MSPDQRLVSILLVAALPLLGVVFGLDLRVEVTSARSFYQRGRVPLQAAGPAFPAMVH